MKLKKLKIVVYCIVLFYGYYECMEKKNCVDRLYNALDTVVQKNDIKPLQTALKKVYNPNMPNPKCNYPLQKVSDTIGFYQDNKFDVPEKLIEAYKLLCENGVTK